MIDDGLRAVRAFQLPDVLLTRRSSIEAGKAVQVRRHADRSYFLDQIRTCHQRMPTPRQDFHHQITALDRHRADADSHVNAFRDEVDAPVGRFRVYDHLRVMGHEAGEHDADPGMQPWGLDALNGPVSEPAWKTKPSWYLIATDDKMIPPPAQHAMSNRAGSTVVEVKGSHAVYVSQPKAVAAFIAKAALEPTSAGTHARVGMQ
jgi:hypothetical protein